MLLREITRDIIVKKCRSDLDHFLDINPDANWVMPTSKTIDRALSYINDLIEADIFSNENFSIGLYVDGTIDLYHSSTDMSLTNISEKEIDVATLRNEERTKIVQSLAAKYRVNN